MNQTLEKIIKTTKNVIIGASLVGMGYGIGIGQNYYHKYYEHGLVGFNYTRVYNVAGLTGVRQEVYNHSKKQFLAIPKKQKKQKENFDFDKYKFGQHTLKKMPLYAKRFEK